MQNLGLDPRQEDDAAGGTATAVIARSAPALHAPEHASEKAVGAAPRLASLDGLRGVAALAVLVCHTLLTVPRLGELAYHSGTSTPGTWEWWLVETPLHVLWEGTGAVYVFFVLSGFVLALPFTRGAASTGGAAAGAPQPWRDPRLWRAYYPKRLARLYLPVWGAVALAATVWAFVPRPKTGSGWVDAMGAPVAWERIAGDLTLLFTDGLVVPPLWSLRWEMWFSLLLPLYLVLGLALPARLRAPGWAVWAAMAAVVVGGGFSNDGVLRDLPLFMLGVLLAAHREQLAAWAARLGAGARGQARSRWVWPGLLAVGITGLWLPWAFGTGTPAAHWAWSGAAVALVVVALHWGPAVRVLSGRAASWLGTVSFSLYLTHEPFVVAAYHLVGPPAAGGSLAALWVSMPLGLAASLAVAAAFHRIVERPSHRIARWLGRRFA